MDTSKEAHNIEDLTEPICSYPQGQVWYGLICGLLLLVPKTTCVVKKKKDLKRHMLPHRWTSKTLGWIREARLRDNIKYDHCEFGFDEKFSNIFHGILSHDQNRKMWTIVVKRTLIGSQIPWTSRRLSSSPLFLHSFYYLPPLLNTWFPLPLSPSLSLALPPTLPFYTSNDSHCRKTPQKI